MKDTILVCSNHQEEYLVPLIRTFAFIGAEYWCPYCGYTGGMLDAGEGAPITPELQERHDRYKQHTQEYRRAVGIPHCAGAEWPLGSGSFVPASQLPEAELERLKRIRTAWRGRVRVEHMATT